MNSIDWALAGRISVLVIVVGWALIAAGLLDVIAEAVHESKHEDALRMDAEWNRRINPVPSVRLATAAEWAEYERAVLGSPPVPPILNQSERWQERARKAESLGFLDSFEDEPRVPQPPRAA